MIFGGTKLPNFQVPRMSITDLPTIPQPVVDACAGFGDTVSLGLTYGIRELMDTNGAVDFSSDSYMGGALAGIILNVRGFTARGNELSIGANFRLAPWGNRTNHPLGRWPHYHRRGTEPGQGINRHRPWETKSPDKSWRDRF
jgi:hypothetical protein